MESARNGPTTLAAMLEAAAVSIRKECGRRFHVGMIGRLEGSLDTINDVAKELRKVRFEREFSSSHESPAQHIRNALTIIQSIHSATYVAELEAAKSRLWRALAQLE